MVVPVVMDMDPLDAAVEKALVDVRDGLVRSGEYWLLQDAIGGRYVHEDASVRDLTREVRMRMLYDGRLVIYDSGPARKVVFAFPEAAYWKDDNVVVFHGGERVE